MRGRGGAGGLLSTFVFSSWLDLGTNNTSAYSGSLRDFKSDG